MPLPENVPTDNPPYSSLKRPRESILIAHDRRELNRIMSDFVGIVRTNKHLKLAHQRIEQLDRAVEEYYLATPATYGVVELRNMTTVAELIVSSALSRKESRGLHYNEDHPDISEGEARDTMIEGKSTDERQRPTE
jgi:L-aspartate oxidase